MTFRSEIAAKLSIVDVYKSLGYAFGELQFLKNKLLIVDLKLGTHLGKNCHLNKKKHYHQQM